MIADGRCGGIVTPRKIAPAQYTNTHRPKVERALKELDARLSACRHGTFSIKDVGCLQL
jgi:hypothetical protein